MNRPFILKSSRPVQYCLLRKIRNTFLPTTSLLAPFQNSLRFASRNCCIILNKCDLVVGPRIAWALSGYTCNPRVAIGSARKSILIIRPNLGLISTCICLYTTVTMLACDVVSSMISYDSVEACSRPKSGFHAAYILR